ncbi:MAG: hypothetical protein A2Y17_01910 [Clostridiales bacterium GWF2_38_85]|nr:MAG: hypothetical protein A2Y17_01910 [Clostridiales bacterium GWF2_38_85]HBL84734.1 hypothetical protein [Clostridiales bacterium]
MQMIEKIKEYILCRPVRFHMPGHKGRLSLFRNNAATFDVTETDETVNIYACSEFNKKLFRDTASIFNADMTLFSCSGATLALQTALMTVAKGKTVLCGEVHTSISNAFALCDISPIYYSEICEDLFIKYSPSAVIMTSEDYYGRLYIDEVKKAAQLCNKYNIPLICDNAHGTHLAFHNDGELHPVKLGADIVIDSAHKTLPVLTGGAFLHLCGRYSEIWNEFMQSMTLFASTSPSYLIAQSLEYGVEYMQKQPEMLDRLLQNVKKVKAELKKKNCLLYDDLELVTDPYRITIIAGNAKEIDSVFKSRHIYSEFTNANHVVLIPSVMNTDADFNKLIKAIKMIEIMPFEQNRLEVAEKTTRILEMSPRKAAFSEHEVVAVRDSIGRITAFSVSAYPPAVPIVHSGERITAEQIEQISKVCEYVTVINTVSKLN